jgi:hypothetical protein
MAFLMVVDLSSKRLIMTFHRVKGHVGRILRIVALHYLVLDRHAIPDSNKNSM